MKMCRGSLNLVKFGEKNVRHLNEDLSFFFVLLTAVQKYFVVHSSAKDVIVAFPYLHVGQQ
jgi:hypothetical protein